MVGVEIDIEVRQGGLIGFHSLFFFRVILRSFNTAMGAKARRISIRMNKGASA